MDNLLVSIVMLESDLLWHFTFIDKYYAVFILFVKTYV